MRLLLDTHTFLWCIGGDTALSPYARQLIEDRTNARLLSIASLFTIKILSTQAYLGARVDMHRYRQPLYHKDPFDRLLIAHGLLGGTISGHRIPLP